MKHAATYEQAVELAGIPQLLDDCDWQVVGTYPLGIDVPGSDIDIVVSTGDLYGLSLRIYRALSGRRHFAVRQWVGSRRCVVASFFDQGWLFEIFADSLSLEQQFAVRHFDVEKRLLEIGGEKLKAEVMRLRGNGLKTEPAFATALGLDGDAYQALFELSFQSDDELMKILPQKFR